MLSLLDFWDTCDPGRLQGTVILVPVANPPAFAAHQRRSSLDGLDLNRTFPGKADGTPSERLAYRLLHEVIAGSDFVFTLHSWYATGMVAPYVEFIEGDDPVATRSQEGAKAAGFRRLRRGPESGCPPQGYPHPGRLRRLHRAGRPLARDQGQRPQVP
jgi:predicted deacylase